MPIKSGELHTRVLDSTRWNDFGFRPNDIVVATWGKSGTTWVMQIVTQIVLGGEERPVADLVVGPSWVESRAFSRQSAMALLESQTHRRILKTHLPVDALVFSPTARYIYVARDPRDSVLSWHNHLKSMSDEGLERVNGIAPDVGRPRVRPPDDARKFFNDFLDGDPDAGPGWPLWSNVKSWWEIRTLPNVLLLHYANLKSDLVKSVSDIAAFLGIELDDRALARVTQHSQFDYMRKSAMDKPGRLAKTFEAGGASFFNKGQNARWRKVLSARESNRCDEIAAQELSRECAHWLKTGEIVN